MTFWTAVVLAAACTVILTRATIFGWLRRGPQAWVKFICCPLCAGWWVGAAFCLIALRQAPPPGVLELVALAVGGGAASGCLALLYALVWDRLDG